MTTVQQLLALTQEVGADVRGLRELIGVDGSLTGLDVPDAATVVEALNAVYARSGRTGPPGKPGAPSFIAGPPGRDGVDGAPGRDGIDGVDGQDGAPGRDGAPGVTGPAGVSSATASSLPAGSSATASVSNGVLSLGIPIGATGAQGTPGTNGTNGQKGDTGATGPVGVSSATASTLAAGSAATASVSNGVLTIGVPIGPKGDTGNAGQTGPSGLPNYPDDATRNANAGTFTGALCATNGVLFRWNGSAWKVWNWLAASGWAANENGYSYGGGGTNECSIHGGMVTFNFSVTRSSGLGINESVLRIQPGFRPVGNIDGNALAGSSSAHGTCTPILDSTGGLIISSTQISGATYVRGTFTYRQAG